jgi:hypothetical protein
MVDGRIVKKKMAMAIVIVNRAITKVKGQRLNDKG